ncbi:basic amino acid ABC transporter substrate-binding protein [Clostridium polyendosporum]|uniref:Basic amino acid ABC transporter substrate-binding protein n=1 Tax=Clostridium polyendosporum TaxID=69208 RepID=A0A919S231_9CLOT|nr:transporter substrate-binding domain-containing protein [Clostridium polyendosporum]GIM30352.1 basic amino acid ABC transporter substrate-binding protein [Clostridium polyendosporum]
MKKYKKLLGIICMTVFLGAITAGCGQKAAEEQVGTNSRIEQIKKNGKLILATGNYRPFEYHDEKTNEVVGYDIDVAKKIADKIGVPLEVRDMQFTSLIPTLQNGQADIVIAAMYINDERKKVIDFAEPYMKTGQVVVARRDNNDIKSVDDLEGKKVGAKFGASSAKVVQEMIDKGKKIELKTYKTNEEYLADLENGRLDAGVSDLLYQLEYNKTHPNLKVIGDPFTKDELGIAVKKGDKELVNLINNVIKEMNESGETDKLYNKWISNVK